MSAFTPDTVVPSGIPAVPMRWGTHLCHFYRGEGDVRAVTIPWLAAGLRNDERCLWITADPLPRTAAMAALLEEVSDASERQAGGQIELMDSSRWFSDLGGPDHDADSAVVAMLSREAAALAAGHTGFRIAHNLRGTDAESRAALQRYEEVLDRALAGRRTVALCSYDVGEASGEGVLEIARTHDGGVVLQDGIPTLLRSTTALIAAVEQTQADTLDADLVRAARVAQRIMSEHRASRRSEDELRKRLALLQTATSALSGAQTAAEIASVVMDLAGPALGAVAVAMVKPGADGNQLDVLMEGALRLHPSDRFRTFPVDAARPLAETFRTRQPIWLSSYEDMRARYPELRQLHEAGLGAAVYVPLVIGGRSVGALGLGFPDAVVPTLGLRAVVDDIARQTAVAWDRARLFEEAQAANRRKDEFLAVLGHELRNPLAPILTALDLLKLKGEPALARERGIIERHARHLRRLIDDLLDVSRITQGKITLKRHPVDVAEVVAGAIDMVSPLLEERALRLAVEVSRGEFTVQADSARLCQAPANLLTNAATYSAVGGRISLSVRGGNDSVHLTVKDEGVGIPQDKLDKVFEPFTRLTQPAAQPHGGLGVGLGIVNAIVELHGGIVCARSEGTGRGAELEIALPLTTTPVKSEPPADSGSAGAPMARHHVLVVDDNVDAANGIADVLRIAGHDVVVAYDGPQALQIARSFPFDVAVIDIGLPVMNGYELVSHLRSEVRDRPVRLLALTGFGAEEDRERALAAGFAAHFVKPAAPDDLLRAVSGEESVAAPN